MSGDNTGRRLAFGDLAGLLVGIVLAIVVVAVVAYSAGQHPHTEAGPQERDAREPSADTTERVTPSRNQQAERAERANYERPCQPGEDQRDSDLCAQWKAADAAADSAWWAAVGSFASALSTVLVLAALYLAFRSNWIARDTAKRQLRAYIGVEPKGVYERDAHGFTVVPIYVHNFGGTPAYHVTIHSWFSLEDSPMDFAPELQNRQQPESCDPTEITLPPGDGEHVYISMPFSPTDEVMKAIARKQMAIIHYGFVVYADAFEEPRYTDFAHYHRGEELSDAEAKRCRLGNHAT